MGNYTDSYNDELKKQREFDRQGCIQFILFFILMAACVLVGFLCDKD